VKARRPSRRRRPCSRRVLLSQSGANFSPRHTGLHPFNDDKVRRSLDELVYGFVSAIDTFDDITLNGIVSLTSWERANR